MRCKSNGNYEGFQVVYNSTYCVNTTSGAMVNNAMPVLRRYYDQLPCSECPSTNFMGNKFKNTYYTDIILSGIVSLSLKCYIINLGWEMIFLIGNLR